MEAGIVCKHCNGTGSVVRESNGQTVVSPCPFCSGGFQALLRADNGYYHSVEVLECIVFSEFARLKADNQAIVQLIISAGYVNLSLDSLTLKSLFEIFREDSETYSNIKKLIE